MQSALNSTPKKKLNGKCLLTVYKALPQGSPLSHIFRRQVEAVPVQKIDQCRKTALIEVQKLHHAIQNIHRNCAGQGRKQQKLSVDAYNRSTGIRPIEFTRGDYVLKSLMQNMIRSNTGFRWQRPFRVRHCQEKFTFKVEDLCTGTMELVHRRRMNVFHNKVCKVSEEL